jgi:NAD+ kinase
MPTVVVYPSEFNPPTLAERAAVAELGKRFDKVVIVPVGPDLDRDGAWEAPPLHRAALADLTFHGLPNVAVDLADLEADEPTCFRRLTERYGRGVEVWFAATVEALTNPQRRKRSGAEAVWNDASWVVFDDPRRPAQASSLPPNRIIVTAEVPDNGREIRRSALEHLLLKEELEPRTADYILRHRLYQGVPPGRNTKKRFEPVRIMLDIDAMNSKAIERAEELRPFQSDDPDLIVVLGGDGTMLRSIRKHWRRRLPFFGLNVGHVGHLLNDADEPFKSPMELLLYQLPLLWVEMEHLDGSVSSGLAFNDAWVERATGQTAWFRVTVDGARRMERVVADGMLVSTAAGSTSYARAMGAPPLPFHTPLLLLVGSNVFMPPSWKSAALRIESEVFVETPDPNRRPLVGYIDGTPQGTVRSMRIRTSRIAAVELAFLNEHDPMEKLARIQFPG